ncbi:MAG: hypothetical protein FI707_12865 [SAR202 cluster bacterium]|nr:hypothetical protein [Chloroflexota bacterium]MDP6422322.1 hypothetical protein [SAR202 cluster bacterium]HAL46151.1 hypothetical protein [Dehalococcoidia bacterium]MDP6663406.1 hypothetical protein [SAR202 cluster bacterium]MDP6801159.1 hypothetical protein [SAR202 cluster bacterium]
MTSDTTPRDGPCRLRITLGAEGLPISQLSRLLRVLQTAVREVAGDEEEARPYFERQHQPRLQLSANVEDGRLALSVFFAELKESTPMPELSTLVFGPFIEQFERFLMTGPQLGLWGPIARGVTNDDEPIIMQRLRDLRTELRHFAGATISFGERAMTFDGDQVTLG